MGLGRTTVFLLHAVDGLSDEQLLVFAVSGKLS